MLEPLQAAVERISAKTPIGSLMRSAEWSRVPVALRERAQFSAAVTSVKLLQTIQDRLSGQIKLQREQLAGGKQATFDRSSFIDAIRDTARAEGIETIESPGERGTVKDIQSIPRLGLIYDMQNAQANGYARFKLDQSPGALMEFPAWEFTRVEDRRHPRDDWDRRWVEAGGRIVDGRMVELKSHPVWQRLSIFGTPWPPFDWGSGMGLEEVDYDEAVSLGLIENGDIPDPTGERDFNDSLESSMRGVSPRHRGQLSSIFGNMVDLVGDDLVWKSEHPAVAPTPEARPADQHDDLVKIQEGVMSPGEAIPSTRSGVTEDGTRNIVAQTMDTKQKPTEPPELMDPEKFRHYTEKKNWPLVGDPQVDVGSTGTFWRKGPPPEGGKSWNFKDQFYEKGVSTYFAPDATSLAGLDDRPWYRVVGELLGFGSDGEPLVRVDESRKAGKKEIAKAINERQELHLKPGDLVFIPGVDFESFTDKYKVEGELRRPNGTLYGYRITSGFGDAINPSVGPRFLDINQTGVRFAPEEGWTRNSHEWLLKRALEERKPVSAAAVEAYQILIPDGYTKSGDRYIPL